MRAPTPRPRDRSCQQSCDRSCSRSGDGFVVPYVLVAIAVLSLATLFAMERLSRNTALIAEIEARAEAETALASARAELTYALLGSSPLREGLDLRGRVDPQQALLIGQAAGARPEPGDPALWVPDGAWRTLPSAAVSLRDATGLFPLNTAQPEATAALLEALGLPRSDARAAGARLADYTDSDATRRPGGAERVQYRNAERPDPANRPLRSLGELHRVLGWDAVLEAIDLTRLAETVTLDTGQVSVNPRYTTPQIAEMLGLGGEAPVVIRNDEFAAASLANAVPGDRQRAILVTGGEHPRLDIVEIERRPLALERPFRIRRLATRAVRPGELAGFRDIFATAAPIPAELLLTASRDASSQR